ncbi:WhiB family transcriptional regulator [Rhodococcus opacus]|nr:WhiB family transcriptional regulator [Rhodococcus opacus]
MSLTTLSTHLYAPRTDLWDWQLRATCRQVETDLFFPQEGETHHDRRGRERAAKRICRTCPVLAQCRTHALSVGEPFGIWGGTTEADRRFRIARPPVQTPTRHSDGRPPAPRRLTISHSHPSPGKRPPQS